MLLLPHTHPQVLPEDVSRTISRREFQYCSIVDELLGVLLVLVQEVVAVVLVLEGDESMADEVREIEQERVVRCVLVVQHYPAIVDELYLLGKGRKTVLLLILALGGIVCLYQSSPLLLQLLPLDESGPSIINDLQSTQVVAKRYRLYNRLRLQLTLVPTQCLQVILLVGIHLLIPTVTSLHPLSHLPL